MRASGHSIRCYASFIVGAVVATGDVTYAPTDALVTKQDVQIDFDTGAYTDVRQGMEVVFTDASGNYKGRTHIRYGGIITSTSIPVREYDNAELLLEIGDKYIIYNEWRVHDKLVAANAQFPPDGLPMTTQNLHPDPVVNSGGATACRVDNGQTYATVLTKGDTTFNTDPASTQTFLHDWSGDGIGFQAGSSASDANPVLEVQAGTRLVYHEAEDDDTGAARVQHVPMRVHTDADPPHDVLITAYEATGEGGWTWAIEVLSGATDLATIPDGCLCILWGDDRLDNAWQAFRNATPGREHILGVGYAARDTSSGDGSTGRHQWTLEVVPPIQREKEITSYSKVMEEAASPNTWAELYWLGILRGIIQIDAYYTTRCEAGFDLLVDPDFLDTRYPAHYLPRDNFYNQKLGLAKAADAGYFCDRTGRYELHTELWAVPLGDRAAITEALEIEEEDILSYEFTRDHAIKVEQYKVSGFSGGTALNAPYYSLVPGDSPAEGIDALALDRLIADESAPQTDVNARAGRYYALAEMQFQDADGLKHDAFDLKVRLPGSYDIFDPAYKEYVRVRIVDNKRGIDLTQFRFYVIAVRMTFDAAVGTEVIDLTLRMETNAAPGRTFVPPDETLNYPSYDYPQFPFQGLPSSGGSGILGRNTANLVMLGTDKNLFYVDLRTGEYALELLSLTGDPVCFIQNPYQTDQAGIATTTQARFVSDLWGTPTPSTAHSFAYTSQFRTMQSSRCTPGLFVVNSHDINGACDIDISLNASTWALAKADLGGTYSGGGGDSRAPGVFASEHVAGKLYAWAFAAGSTNQGRLYVSTDGAGAVWSTLDSNTTLLFNPGLTIPVQATSDNVIYSGGEVAGLGNHLYKTVNGTRTDISPSYGGETYGPGDISNSFCVKTCDIDQNTVLLVGQNINDTGRKWGVFLSRDGGATWQVLIAPATTVLWRSCNIAGDDRNTFFLWGANGALAVSYDGGATWLDRSYPGVTAATFLNIIGR